MEKSYSIRIDVYPNDILLVAVERWTDLEGFAATLAEIQRRQKLEQAAQEDTEVAEEGTEVA